jgi:hypothetical protein
MGNDSAENPNDDDLFASLPFIFLENAMQQVNGAEFSLPPAFDMKAFKAEMLKEMRSEITKAKNEIIDGEWKSNHFDYLSNVNFLCCASDVIFGRESPEKCFAF